MPDFKTQLQQAKDLLGQSDFHKNRESWDLLLHRKWKDSGIPPEMAIYLEGAEYQTPDLEKAARDWADIATTNPTIFDLSPIDQTPDKKKKARDILMWMARGWELENAGRWWDRSAVQGLVRHGIKVFQQSWHPQKSASTTSEARHRRHPFYWKDIDLFSYYWVGDNQSEYGPDWAASEVEIPYVEAKSTYERKTETGTEYLSLDSLGNCSWLAQDQPVDAAHAAKRIKVTTIDSRNVGGEMCPLDNCDHPARTIYVYVCGENQPLEDSQLFDSYPSPFPGCSFHMVADNQSWERDPDLRFRPILFPVYVDANEVNTITNWLLAMARLDYSTDNLYVNGAGIEDVRLRPEGESPMVKKASPGSTEIPWFPGKVERMPSAISPHLMTIRQDLITRMQSHMPNHLLTGEANTEMSNATGSAFLQQVTQASLPANSLLSILDATILKSRTYETHAIRVWGLDDPEGTQTDYYAVMTGNNKNIGVRGKSAKSGEVFTVTAKDFAQIDYDLTIITKSETLTEQQLRWNLAWDKYVKGVLTPEQLIREAGIDDVEGQKELLEAAGDVAIMEPLSDVLKKQVMTRIFSAASETDINQLLTTPPDPSATGQGGMGGGSPNSPTGNTMINGPTQMARSQAETQLASGAPMAAPLQGGGSPL